MMPRLLPMAVLPFRRAARACVACCDEGAFNTQREEGSFEVARSASTTHPAQQARGAL